ncbi:hypothetical protein [Cryptosporangium phraense]|uniref:DUF1440 domain-containing protein n=1 Tax=Cryptosporangium phraense TaxID=2593070 RepID=A0A545AKM2_9ACTN|nr:hypothetical protein [Cryptosporangium phraense]TQS41872.1 hypothetical protein FL583_26670 [Cryptosporangium phraense]
MLTALLRGAAAGAAGTTALNAATYLDMSWRGRPSSSAPEDTVEKIAGDLGHPVPGDPDTRGNRLTGLGALSGILTGVGIGAVAGVLHRAGLRRLPAALGAVVVGGAAMASTDASMARLGISDPRTWSTADWLSDALPHLAYGAVTWAVLDALTEAHRD